MKADMDVRPYAACWRDAWNSLNRDARNGHFMFDRGFMEYHSDRFTDASLVVSDNDRAIALLPANIEGETVHSHQGLTFGGLVSETCGTAAVLRILDQCAEHWRKSGASRLVYKPLPWIYQRRPAQEDLYWLFRRDARLVRRDVSTAIDLRAPGRRSGRRDRGVRKAVKAGVRCARSDRWADYWDLLARVLAARHGAKPVHSVDEITRLAANFPENITLHTAEFEGEIFAGVVIFAGPQVAHAQYIAVGETGRELGALDQLFDHLIGTHPGARYFDFGISNTDQGKTLNEGLIGQKEEFGGSAVVHDFYEINLR